MAQAWLQVIGLVLDFCGFALIAFEWLLAQRSERALDQIRQAEARAAEGRSHLARVSTNPGMQRHLEAVGDMERRRAELAAGASRAHYAKRRYGAIYAGMVMVLLGFVGQLLGAWPGCCSMLGIVPAG